VLDRHRVAFVVIGGLARVIEGTDEITRGVDITPSTKPENLRRLGEALEELGVGETGLDADEPATFVTSHGELRVVPVPAGTRGYDDLRRAAVREPLGQGLRPAVASKGDLARMLSALGRDDDVEKLRQLRRLIELEEMRAIAVRRRAARGTNRMPGVASVVAASERMHLRLAGYGDGRPQVRPRFADVRNG
jgi:hypothetical protein